MVRLLIKLVKTFVVFSVLFYFWNEYMPGTTPMDFLDYIIKYLIG